MESLSEAALGNAPDWSEHARVPITGRANRYGFGRDTYLSRIESGRGHAVWYPVAVTDSWLPKRLIETMLKDVCEPTSVPQSLFGSSVEARLNLDDIERWLGLPPYPDCNSRGAQGIPFPGAERPEYRMGSTRVVANGVETVTYSCAGCHASRLFGRSVLGLQNRAAHANVGIELVRNALQNVSVEALRALYGLGDHEVAVVDRLREAMSYVGVKAPLVRGLDTSLTQVALSLAKRAKDPYATRDPALRALPRLDRLDVVPADSKPAPWWTLKYKNRWLLDGSVVSGNPVYTNLLWNEIGRGTDLHELESWLDSNAQVIEELTAAVFASEPVRFTDFFAPESIDVEGAKRGKLSFEERCARCHGSYQKGWELPHARALALADRLATVEVRYHEDTPVFDVGTDPLRSQGMQSLLQLNELAISKKSGTVIKLQTGYVPPPLVGIWARYPYFHNNSAPTLCAVLTRASERPARYYSGAQNDPDDDFDRDCNGYPSGDKVPASWLDDSEAQFDTARIGMSNRGHDEGVFLADGVEIFTPSQKHDLIMFLQTL